jgi:transcriptional regulator with XRE-family HTH domain
MPNDRLHAALKRAGLTIEEFADIIAVDPKSVGRWLTGTVPHPRRRAKIAAALDVPEADLWPETASAEPLPAAPRHAIAAPHSAATRTLDSGNGEAPVDAISTLTSIGGELRAYRAVTGRGAPDWRELILSASRQIDLLEPAIASVILLPGTIDLLVQNAAAGCQVRIVTGIPVPQLLPLLDKAGIDLHWTEPTVQSSYRFDDEYLVPLRIGDADDRFPVFHFHRDSEPWLAERLERRFDEIWEHHSGQVVSPAQRERQSQAGPERDQDSAESGQTQTPEAASDGQRQPTSAAASVLTDQPRRWPGRRP